MFNTILLQAILIQNINIWEFLPILYCLVISCVKSLETLWSYCDFRFPCVFSYLPEVRKHSNSCWSEVTNAIGDRVVYLSSRELSKVPEAVSNLTELEELDSCQIIIWQNYQQVLTSWKIWWGWHQRWTSWENILKSLPSWVTWPCLVWVTSCLLYLQTWNISRISGDCTWVVTSWLHCLMRLVNWRSWNGWMREWRLETTRVNIITSCLLAWWDNGELKKLKVLLVAGNPVTLEEMVPVLKIQKISSHTYETRVLFHLYSPSSPGLTWKHWCKQREFKNKQMNILSFYCCVFNKNSKEQVPNLSFVFHLNNQIMSLRFPLDDSWQGAAWVNYHTEIKSDHHSKICLNPFHRHLKNAKNQPPFCQQAHTASLLTIYNWIRDNFIISLQDISIYNIYLQLL